MKLALRAYRPDAPDTFAKARQARPKLGDGHDLIGQRVAVFRNLNTGTFSVQHRRKTVAHTMHLELENAHFRVGQEASKKVEETTDKTVHAHVVGTLRAVHATAPAPPEGSTRVNYEPHLGDRNFKQAEAKTRVTHARHVLMTSHPHPDPSKPMRNLVHAVDHADHGEAAVTDRGHQALVKRGIVAKAAADLDMPHVTTAPTSLRARPQPEIHQAAPARSSGLPAGMSARMPGHDLPKMPGFHPPKGPDGETLDQAVERLKPHIDAHVHEHVSHLRHLESEHGIHVPWGTLSFTSGLPGAGKTTYLKNHHYRHGTFSEIDTDALKEHLPGYDPKAPQHVHAHSKMLFDHFRDALKRHRAPVVVDGIGDNHAKMKRLIDEHREAGYGHVGLHVVRVRPEVAQARNARRPRSLPASVIDHVTTEMHPDYPGDPASGRPPNAGRTPLQHVVEHLRTTGMRHRVHVHDSEDAPEREQRARDGWRHWLDQGGRMAKAAGLSLIDLARATIRATIMGPMKGAR